MKRSLTNIARWTVGALALILLAGAITVLAVRAHRGVQVQRALDVKREQVTALLRLVHEGASLNRVALAARRDAALRAGEDVAPLPPPPAAISLPPDPGPPTWNPFAQADAIAEREAFIAKALSEARRLSVSSDHTLEARETLALADATLRELDERREALLHASAISP